MRPTGLASPAYAARATAKEAATTATTSSSQSVPISLQLFPIPTLACVSKSDNQTRRRSVEMRRAYRRDAELFNGTAAAWAAAGEKNKGPTQIADLKADNAGHC